MSIAFFGNVWYANGVQMYANKIKKYVTFCVADHI